MERAHAGVPPRRTRCQERVLAEELAGLETRQDDLGRVEGLREDLHRAARDHEHPVAVLALAQDGLSRRHDDLRRPRGERGELRLGQRCEGRDALQEIQGLGGGNGFGCLFSGSDRR